jgi:hypothetical protein
MTWAEFQIRLFAYNRIQKRIDFRFREVAYASLTGSHSDPKRLPKTIEKFWSLDGKKQAVGLNEIQKKAILKAQEQYLKNIKDA